MSDRELLEWAAKAAGLRFRISNEWHDKGAFIADEDYWNPLVDDGDAFRLAVKLDFYVGPRSVEVFRCGREVCNIFEDMEDPCAATRRAIVRAAASIGQQKEK